MRSAALLVNDAAAGLSPSILGGKGAGLVKLSTHGLPVPPAFIVPTGICRAYLQHGVEPRRLEWHLKRGIAELETQTGRKFNGSEGNPLLVSVRSGAPTSMPGMMDTILNVGFNSHTHGQLVRLGGEEFANAIYYRMKDQFGKITHTFPTDPWFVLGMSVLGVFDSWNSERARAYRDSQNIPHWTGTAVTVQAMVYGNLDDHSCTGVVFSHDTNTGEADMTGEFLVKAQGEDIVSGVQTPWPIDLLRVWNSAVYDELNGYVTLLSELYDSMVDVEFTVESGRLYILQVRKATRSAQAAITFAVRKVWKKEWTREQAVQSVSNEELLQLGSSNQVVTNQLAFDTRVIARGIPACPGLAYGYVVTSSKDALLMHSQGNPVILVTEDTTPDDLPGMLVSKAIVTANGGATCHAAVVARAQGIPAVVGVGNIRHLRSHFDHVTVDGTQGKVACGQYELQKSNHGKEVNIFMRWARPRAEVVVPRIGFEWLEKRVYLANVLTNFYVSDALVAETVGMPSAVSANALRSEIHKDAAEMLAAYLTVAIAGEARHFGRCMHRAHSSERRIANLLEQEYLLREGTRNTAQENVVSVLRGQTLQAQIRFVDNVVQLFESNAWPDAYGGVKWAVIAQTLLKYLQGVYSATVFVDHVFDLRHNGGAMFDKHPMVSMYAHEDQIQDMLGIKKVAANVHELARVLGIRRLHANLELLLEEVRLQSR